jgi:hypothetical protein
LHLDFLFIQYDNGSGCPLMRTPLARGMVSGSSKVHPNVTMPMNTT